MGISPVILSMFVSGRLYGEIPLIYVIIIGLDVAAFFLAGLGLEGISMVSGQLHNKTLGYVAALAWR